MLEPELGVQRVLWSGKYTNTVPRKRRARRAQPAEGRSAAEHLEARSQQRGLGRPVLQRRHRGHVHAALNGRGAVGVVLRAGRCPAHELPQPLAQRAQGTGHVSVRGH